MRDMVFCGANYGPLVRLSLEEEREAFGRGDTHLLIMSQLSNAVKFAKRSANERLDIESAFFIAVESLCQSINSFDPCKGTLYSWSSKVMWNALKKHFIRDRRLILVNTEEQIEIPYEAREDGDDNVQLIRGAISQIADERIRAVVTGVIQGVPRKVIAEQLGTTTQTVNNLQKKAVKAIREILSEQGYA